MINLISSEIHNIKGIMKFDQTYQFFDRYDRISYPKGNLRVQMPKLVFEYYIV